MSRKNKNNRKTAQQIVESFTREDIISTIAERNEITSHVLKITQVIEAMKAAGMAEDAIQVVREQVAEGTMKRVSYLEYKVRRVAIALTRSQGYNHWRNIVENNLDAIPTAAEKQKVTLATM
jgi:hypothetical protein